MVHPPPFVDGASCHKLPAGRYETAEARYDGQTVGPSKLTCCMAVVLNAVTNTSRLPACVVCGSRTVAVPTVNGLVQLQKHFPRKTLNKSDTHGITTFRVMLIRVTVETLFRLNWSWSPAAKSSRAPPAQSQVFIF